MNIALTIAGSDSGGGAGIQADLKTFHQFGVFGTSAVVAITAQNTRGVSAVHHIPAETVRAQIAALADDLPPDACKSGMLATAALVTEVAAALRDFAFPNYVLDPVMVATSGDRLLDAGAEQALLELLVPLAHVVTPNIPEAEILTGISIAGVDDMIAAATSLIEAGAGAALIKGGHMTHTTVTDVLRYAGETHTFERPRLSTTSTHGTGCTLSAAITAGLARGTRLVPAVADALDFVHRAIAAAPGLGGGSGPLNHFVEAGHAR